MLDDVNVLNQRGTLNVLMAAGRQFKLDVREVNISSHNTFNSVLLVGGELEMQVFLIIKVWLKDKIAAPFDFIKTNDMPEHIKESVLVIKNDLLQTDFSLVNNVYLVTSILVKSGLVYSVCLDEISENCKWLNEECIAWGGEVLINDNLAKKLALKSVGKSAVFYSSSLMTVVAYKWKKNWNKYAKNLAFCAEISESNSSEFLGWISHPVEKPFAVFDFSSNLEDLQIIEQFDVFKRFLSGKRPSPISVNLNGESLLGQILWGCALADYTSIYLAILNGVNPLSN